MTRALVTGAAGQDGAYLCEALLATGVEVHALVRAGRTGAHLPADVVAHDGDVCDVDATRRLLLDLAPDQVFNLAAISSVAQSWEWPDLAALVNGTAAVALLESAHQAQRRAGRQVRFVQASSAEIFGRPDEAPQTEATAIRPVSPYGAAKAYAHHMVGVYRSRDLHTSSLILYNHESPRRPRHFVTRKITAGVADIVAGRADRLVLGDLDVCRDWGWAPDYVDAMVRAAGATTPSDYVVASGESHSLREFVAAAFAHVDVTAWEDLVDHDPGLARPEDPLQQVGSPARAETVLGWRRTRGFTDVVGAMVEADLAQVPGAY